MKNTSILKNLNIPSGILEAIAAADKTLATGPRTAEAIKNNAENILTARSESAAAEKALAQAEAAAVVCDEADLPEKNQAVVEAAKLFDEKHLALKRAERLDNTLKANAQTIDFDVAQAREAFNSATSLMASVARDEIAAEFGEALKPLLKILRRAAALQAVLPSRDLGFTIAEMNIPNPASWASPFVSGGRLNFDGKVVDIYTTWRDDPDALKIFEAFQVISEARQRLGSHTPFRDTQPATGRGYTIGGNPDSYKAKAISTSESRANRQELNLGPAMVEKLGAANYDR